MFIESDNSGEGSTPAGVVSLRTMIFYKHGMPPASRTASGAGLSVIPDGTFSGCWVDVSQLTGLKPGVTRSDVPMALGSGGIKLSKKKESRNFNFLTPFLAP